MNSSESTVSWLRMTTPVFNLFDEKGRKKAKLVEVESNKKNKIKTPMRNSFKSKVVTLNKNGKISLS